MKTCSFANINKQAEALTKTYSSCGCTHEDILIRLVRHRVHDRLDTIEGGIGLEGSAAECIHFRKSNDLLASATRGLSGDRDDNLFIVL